MKTIGGRQTYKENLDRSETYSILGVNTAKNKIKYIYIYISRSPLSMTVSRCALKKKKKKGEELRDGDDISWSSVGS